MDRRLTTRYAANGTVPAIVGGVRLANRLAYPRHNSRLHEPVWAVQQDIPNRSIPKTTTSKTTDKVPA